MAQKTKCLTPECIFSTRISPKEISVIVTLPEEINISKEEAILLEKLLHNQVEICLRPYFIRNNYSIHSPSTVNQV